VSMASFDRTKILLSKVYLSQFVSDSDFWSRTASDLLSTPKQLENELKILEGRGLVEFNGERMSLTKVGRSLITVVMCGGAFDIIHPGHVETLEQARSLGDVLVVSVARDSTFERNKKRKPEHGEALRKTLVSAVRAVDLAVLGSETDIFETVELLKPDVIALGYDQFHDEVKISDEAKRRGVSVRVVRLKSSNPDIKTTAIIGRKSGDLGI
jgi:FAD synthetase